MNFTNRCFGCMEPMESGAAACGVCGAPAGGAQKLAWALPAGTIIKGRYVLGVAESCGETSLTYVAFDYLTETKVRVEELFPKKLWARGPGGRAVWDPEKQALSGRLVGIFGGEMRRIAAQRLIPGLMGVLNVIEENDTVYAVLEWAEGMTLAKRMEGNGGAENLSAILACLHPAVTALAELHSQGIYHLGVSPDTIFYTAWGDTKLMGSGIVQTMLAREYGEVQTASNPYAPPEALESRYGDMGPWTDVYGVAAVIYRMATGTPPRHSLERIKNPGKERIPAFRKRTENCILTALQTDGGKRQPNIGVLYQQLCGGNASTSTYEETEEHRLSRTQTILLGAGIALLAGGILVAALASGRMLPAGKDEQLPEEEAAALLPQEAGEPEEAEEAYVTAKVLADGIRLRSTPDKENPDNILAELPKDEIVRVYEQSGDFYRVYVPGLDQVGYIHVTDSHGQSSLELEGLLPGETEAPEADGPDDTPTREHGGRNTTGGTGTGGTGTSGTGTGGTGTGGTGTGGTGTGGTGTGGTGTGGTGTSGTGTAGTGTGGTGTSGTGTSGTGTGGTGTGGTGTSGTGTGGIGTGGTGTGGTGTGGTGTGGTGTSGTGTGGIGTGGTGTAGTGTGGTGTSETGAGGTGTGGIGTGGTGTAGTGTGGTGTSETGAGGTGTGGTGTGETGTGGTGIGGTVPGGIPVGGASSGSGSGDPASSGGGGADAPGDSGGDTGDPAAPSVDPGA